jgi:outer membrane lipoprotein SlyB
VAGAAVSLILVSLLGAAAIAGWLPTSHGTPDPNSQGSAPLALNGSGNPNSNLSGNLSGNLNGNLATPAPTAPLSPAPHLAQGKHHTSGQTGSNTQYSNNGERTGELAQAPLCPECGTVESVQRTTRPEAHGSGVGAVAGAVLGGVLGHQVGGGNGRKLATVAGAIGGGLAGNEIEKRNHSETRYTVRVRMADGSIRSFNPASDPGLQNGDKVKVVDGQLTLRG